MKTRTLLVIIVTLLANVLLWASESTKDLDIKYPDPKRWADTMKEFQEWDSKNTYPKDAVLFVGSSSIRYWKTADAFADLPVINRGFGGSYMADALYYVNELVIQYKPNVVIVYEGDNDITGSIPPRLVHQDFVHLADAIHTALPQTEIICLTTKICSSRWDRRDAVMELNQLNEQYAQTKPYITFVDTASSLLATDGTPRDEFFMPDKLHLNESGYAQWNRILAPIIAQKYPLTHKKSG